MPRETIGTAFVRIIADGKGLKKSIKKAFDDADPAAEEGGRQHSEAYTKAFDAQNKKNRNIEKSLVRSVERAFGRIEANTDFLGGNFQRNLANKIADNLRELGDDTEIGRRAQQIGDRVAQNMTDGFAKSGSLPHISGSLQGEIDKAFNQIIKDEKDLAVQWRKELEQIDADTARISQNIVTSLGKEGQAVQRLGKDMEKLGYTIKHDVTKEYVELSTQSEKVSKRLREQNLLLTRYNHHWGRFANTVGIVTGRGSRNNFLNFIGSMTRNITLLAGAVGSLVPRMYDFGKAIFGVLHSGGGLKGLFDLFSGGGGIKGMLAGISKVTVAGAILFVAITALVTLVAGPLVAAFSLLLGIIVSLASALTVGLIAGIAVLGTLLIPVIAGIGVLTGAILAMDDAMKKTLKNAVEPLVEEMKTLGEIAAEELFRNAPEQARRLGKVMLGLRGLVRGVAIAISDVGDFFLDMMEGKGFKNFVREFSNALPGMIRRLGHITAQSLGGIGGIFIAAIPMVQRFLLWLDRVTERFNVWANSPRGQVELENFFKRAGDAARSVGHALEEITALLATIIGGTQEQGSGIFDDIANAAERFNHFLQDNPDALANWAEDSREFARSIGRVLLAIAGIIDEMDSEENREKINKFFREMEKWLGRVERAVAVLDATLEAFIFLYNNFSFIGWMERLSEKWDKVGRKINQASVFLEGVIQLLHRLSETFFSIPGIGPALAALRLVADAVHAIIRAVETLTRKILDIPSPDDGKLNFIKGTGANTADDNTNAELGDPKGSKRPLADDPALRMLTYTGSITGSTTGSTGGKTIDASGWTIVSPNNAEAVATETLNRLAAAAYI